MKIVSQIILDGKECKALIAKALDIPEDHVVSLRYNFAIDGHTEEEIAEKLREAGVS